MLVGPLPTTQWSLVGMSNAHSTVVLSGYRHLLPGDTQWFPCLQVPIGMPGAHLCLTLPPVTLQ